MTKKDNDCIQRFIFEEHHIRGAIVHLDHTYREAATINSYELPIKKIMGEAMAALCLMACRMKFDGVMTLQLKTDALLEFLVVQVKDEFSLRANAFCNDQNVPDDFEIITGRKGTLAVSIEHKLNKQPYQGIVDLVGDNFAEAATEYLQQSEQLTSKLWLFADENKAVGLMLQVIPLEKKEDIAAQKKYWNHLVSLTNTITREELLHLNNVDMLYRLYHQESIKTFDPKPTCFKCFCTQNSMETAMRGMPYQELLDLLEEESKIRARCEFCNKMFLFDKIDVVRIYHKGALDMASKTKH